ncbi:MAG: TIGR03986 family CRISPR-associated RAMP protein [Thermodesulfobacteriota bacterium]|nr:TIGR03986 family CRISPR-associated RAMP protein [Thermodesulfobacteriota bacterium]
MDSDDLFMNPYNFVRYLSPTQKEFESPEEKLLGKCLPPPHDRYIGLNGKIKCELEAITPIFISDSEYVQEDDGHKSYQFFKLMDENEEEKYAIPSTSLRGMLRSIFEASTNSCFSVFEGGLLGKRERPESYDKTPLLAGFIEEIPKSKDAPGSVKPMEVYSLPHREFPDFRKKFKKNGDKVLIKVESRKVTDVKSYSDAEKTEGFIEGYLKTSDEGIGKNKKTNEYVFVLGDESQDFKLSYETYLNYVISNRNNKHEHTKYPRHGDTIWFRAVDNTIKEFGYAQIYRKPFEKSIGDLLPRDHLHPCTCYESLCPACRVFGWVCANPQEDLKKKVAYAGRVRVSHAEITEYKGVLSEFPFPLSILSMPKPTTTYFYLLNKDGKPDFHVKYDTYGAKLRGRKFYRHQTEAKKEEYQRSGGKKDKTNRTVRDALNPGAKFEFTIEFENLAPVEMGALLWSIEMEDAMHHRLGLAKPLGFGSVKISIIEVLSMNARQRYTSFTNDWWEKIESPKIREFVSLFRETMEVKYGDPFDELDNIKDLKAILSPHSPDIPVHYPRISKKSTKDGKNFKWFVNNQRNGKKPLSIAPDDEGLPLAFGSDNRNKQNVKGQH